MWHHVVYTVSIARDQWVLNCLEDKNRINLLIHQKQSLCIHDAIIWKQVACALHDSYCSLNIIKVTKSRETKWMGHAACMDILRNMKILSHDEWRERDNLGDAGTDGRIILKCVRKTHSNRVWNQMSQDTVQWQAPENSVWNSSSITGGEIMTFRALNRVFKNNCSMDLSVMSFQELVLVWQQYRASICCRSTLVHVSL